MQQVIGVENPDQIPAGHPNPFIHRIITTLIWLTGPGGDLRCILPNNLDAAIGCSPVDNEVLHVWVVLAKDALYRLFQILCAVVDDRDDRDFLSFQTT